MKLPGAAAHPFPFFNNAWRLTSTSRIFTDDSQSIQYRGDQSMTSSVEFISLWRGLSPRMLITVIWWLAIPALAWGIPQPSTPTGNQPEITADSIEAIRKAAASATDLDAETKQKIESLCATSLENLKKIQEFNAKATQFHEEAANVALRVAELRQTLNRLQKREPDISSDLTVAQLKQEIPQRELGLVKYKAELAEAEAEPANRVARRQAIRSLLLTYNQTLETLKKQLALPPPANEPKLLTSAREMTLKVSQMLLLAEVPAGQNELSKYDAEDATDYLRLKRDIAARQVELAEQELHAMQRQLGQKRAADLANKVITAEAQVANSPEPIQFAAEENVELAKESKSLLAPIRETTGQLESVRAQLEGLQKEFRLVEQRVKEIGLTGSIGAMLRRQKSNLPDIATLSSNVQSRKSLIEDVQYQSYEFEDLRSKSIDDETKRILGQVAMADRTPELEAAVQEVIKNRRALLDDVIRNYKVYLDTLFDIDATEQLLILEASRYENYIDERVLWIRSNKPLYLSFSVDKSDLWVVSSEKWNEVLANLAADFREHMVLFVFAILIIAYLFLMKPRFRRELDSLGEAAEKGTCTRYGPTMRAALITVLLAVTWPGIVSFIAWRLTAASEDSSFGFGLAAALFTVTWTAFPLELLRRACRKGGLADSHFNWPEPICRNLRSNIQLFLPPAMLITLVTSLLYYSSSEHGSDAIERVTFIAGFVVLAIFLHRVLHRESGVVCWYHAGHADSLLGRMKGVWYWLGLATPLVLIALTVMGYYYTAQRLTWELYTTYLFLMVLQFLRAFLERWLTVRRRAISIEQRRERQAESQSSAEAETTGLPAEVEQLISEDSEPDVAINAEQTRRLFQTGYLMTIIIGLWLIWVDVLPALKMLDRWPIWMTTVSATETGSEKITPPMGGSLTTTTPTAAVAPGTPTEQLKAVTVADIGLALLIGVVTFVCAKNIPGLMEISILKKLPFDNSVRYAITSITSYLIVLIGLILAFNAISIGWSKVQWLATALTFGLAFGLQEIFANFVAGLILLFERPIRVGDIVTVDDVTGVVSRIRIRATTIVNWDRKEYVVPNREFITGRMLNWTLSDKVNRITIAVGVAYGSDVAKAKALIKKTCEEHPMILDDPKTVVTFEGFGDNSLNLTARTFLPDLENRLVVIDELHSKINSVFAEAGIEISFPQRDLHIRSVDSAIVDKIALRSDTNETPETKSPDDVSANRPKSTSKKKG